MTARTRVSGIGGVFLKARDPVALAAWYREHLGVPVAPDGTHAVFEAAPADGSSTIWSSFPADTTYFGPGPAGWMINYRVPDLHAMLGQLRAEGVWVSDEVQEGEYGRFGWASDAEGNRFELWEPPAEESVRDRHVSTSFRPAGYSTVSPYLVVPAPVQIIDFLATAFGASELRRFAMPDGAVMHAEVRLGDSVVMIGGAGPSWPASPAHVHAYVPDVDAAYASALAAGGVSVQAPAHRAGEPDRRAGVSDPAGNTWWISTRVA